MRWRTAAYDVGPGLPVAPRLPAPKGVPPLRTQDPAAGFRIGRPKSKEFRLDAFIPLHGTNRYVADPVLSDPTAMAKATKTMLGQPLLLVPKSGRKKGGALVAREETYGLLYSESDSSHGYVSFSFDELKSLGRAWLTQEDAPTSTQPSVAAVSVAKKTARRGAAKKSTRAGQPKQPARSRAAGKAASPTSRSRRPTRKSKR
jgi:hypothetical protein